MLATVIATTPGALVCTDEGPSACHANPQSVWLMASAEQTFERGDYTGTDLQAVATEQCDGTPTCNSFQLTLWEVPGTTTMKWEYSLYDVLAPELVYCGTASNPDGCCVPYPGSTFGACGSTDGSVRSKCSATISSTSICVSTRHHLPVASRNQSASPRRRTETSRGGAQ